MTQTDLHNRLAGEIVAAIVRPTLQSGGTMADVLVLCESVIVGVALAAIRLGGDEIVLDTMLRGAKQRLAAIRLNTIPPAGEA